MKNRIKIIFKLLSVFIPKQFSGYLSLALAVALMCYDYFVHGVLPFS